MVLKPLSQLMLASTCVTALACPVHAQAAPSAGQEQEASGRAPNQPGTNAGPSAANAPADQATAATADPNTITITGSRVITNGNNSPTPVTIVSAQKLAETTPSSITEGLTKLPVFTNPPSRITTSYPGQNINGSYVDLRGLGPTRTLVLLDGRRLNPTTQTGEIDTSIIPQLLIQRVDVVTGGASAVYGSDAVSGVVNFVLDHHFEGVRILAQAGTSTYGDLGSQRLGAAFGSDLFGGRGHFEASVEYFNSAGLNSNYYARPNGQKVYAYAGNGTAANPFVLIENSRTSFSALGGTAASFFNSLNPIFTFSADGNVRPITLGAPTSTPTIRQGGDTAFIDGGFAAATDSIQSLARFDFDVASNVKFHAEAMGSIQDIHGKYLPGGFAFLVVRTNNPFLTPAAQAALTAAAGPAFLFSKHDPSIPDSLVDTRVESYRLDAGLDGTFSHSGSWSLDYSHSESSERVINRHNVNNQDLWAATDAVRDSSGQIVCRVTLTNPGLYPGCVPLNLFGPGSVTPAMGAFYARDTQFTVKNKLDDVSAQITASPFSTWAGPVVAALSGEFRHASLTTVSSDQPGLVNCTGLDPFNCSPAKATWVTNVVGNESASQDVEEGALEVNVPILANSPVLGTFNLLGAFRYTHYSTSGNAETWKVGADWKLTNDLTLRATRSRDIRAPSLYELFAPKTIAPGTFFDVHTNTTNITNLISQGNPNLVPEVAQTLTLGAVYKPHWFPGFSLAVDYFNIRLGNAVAQISGFSPAVQVNCESSNGASPFCALYVRPGPFSDRSAANAPLYVLAEGLNVASIKTHGIDVEANYHFSFLGGDLALRGLLTYQPALLTTQFPGDTPINGAGAAQGAVGTDNVAKWRVTGFLTYQRGPFAINVQERWRSSLNHDADPRLIFADPRKVPSVAFTDVSISYTAKASFGSVETFLSVENILNTQAPLSVSVGSFPGLATYAYSGDDQVGRYFTAGVRLKF